MRKTLACVAAALIVATTGIAPAGAAARIIVVDNGTTCPHPDASTVQSGVDLAHSGDTVLVCDGTYAGGVRILTPHLSLLARHDWKVYLTPTGATGLTPTVGISVLANDVTIRGFDISGFQTGSGAGAGILVGGDEADSNFIHVADRSKLIHNRVSLTNNGIYLQSSSNNKVLGNSTFDNKNATGKQGSGIAICADTVGTSTRIGTHNLVAGNWVSNNDRDGIYDGQCNNATTTPVTTLSTIVHNTVTGSSAGTGQHVQGITVFFANGDTIAWNQANGNNDGGIFFGGADGGVVKDNTANQNDPSSSGAGGIVIYNATHTTTWGNTTDSNGTGISVTGTDTSTFADNSSLSNSNVDMYWDSSGANTFSDNDCTTATPSTTVWACT